jgi:hypothetical protein
LEARSSRAERSQQRPAGRFGRAHAEHVEDAHRPALHARGALLGGQPGHQPVDRGALEIGGAVPPRRVRPFLLRAAGDVLDQALRAALAGLRVGHLASHDFEPQPVMGGATRG